MINDHIVFLLYTVFLENGNDDLQEICQTNNFPSHILHLRALTDASPPGLEQRYSVHSISTILEDSQFGPFPCSILDAENDDVNKEDGCFVTVCSLRLF